MLPLLYHAHHNRHLEDLPFWLSLADESGGPVLELGCGTGRVLLPMAKAGYRVIGLDHDLKMLHFLKTNFDKHKMPGPTVVAADIGRFRLAEQFPLIILPCNTFSTLGGDQRKACLWCVSEHLGAMGTFAFSVPNPEVLMRLPVSSDPELEDEFIDTSTGNPIQVSSSWKRKNRVFGITWIYDQLLPNGKVERTATTIEHQLVSCEIYLREIQGAGLSVREVYGDYDRTAYQEDSPNLIILAKHGLH